MARLGEPRRHLCDQQRAEHRQRLLEQPGFLLEVAPDELRIARLQVVEEIEGRARRAQRAGLAAGLLVALVAEAAYQAGYRGTRYAGSFGKLLGREGGEVAGAAHDELRRPALGLGEPGIGVVDALGQRAGKRLRRHRGHGSTSGRVETFISGLTC
jgi:hypothetical protein